MTERRVRNLNRPQYGRPQAMGKRKPKPRIRLGLVQTRIIIILLSFALFFVLLKIIFDIKTINVSSTQRSSEIHDELSKAIAADLMQQNQLTINVSKLQSYILSHDPMVKSIDVHRSWPSKLNVNVVLKAPSLGWSSGNQVYVLDRDGSAIGIMTEKSTLPVVLDGSNLPVELGKRVASSRFISFVSDLNQSLINLKVNPQKYEVKETTIDLYVTTDKGFQLILDTSRRVSDQVGDLQSLMTYLKTHPSPAQYIDLRIGGKAYYK